MDIEKINNKKKVVILTNNIECERTVQYFAKLEKYFITNNWEVINSFEGADLVI